MTPPIVYHPLAPIKNLSAFGATFAGDGALSYVRQLRATKVWSEDNRVLLLGIAEPRQAAGAGS